MKDRVEAAHRIYSVSPVERPSLTVPLSGPFSSVFSHLQTGFAKKRYYFNIRTNVICQHEQAGAKTRNTSIRTLTRCSTINFGNPLVSPVKH